MKFRFADQEVDYKDIDDSLFGKIYEKCAPYCMHSLHGRGIEPMFALYANVQYVVKHQIPGDIVECGAWMGGMPVLIALTLRVLDDTDRKIYIYDTFEGMPEPISKDQDWDGNSAHLAWQQQTNKGEKWGYGGSLEACRELVLSSGYPEENLIFVKGMVEDTIPDMAPETISILRLDTDLYASTYHELNHLFPRLSVGGILTIDDYGYYRGAREATDQYFEENKTKIFLNRIDSSVRQAIKIEE